MRLARNGCGLALGRQKLSFPHQAQDPSLGGADAGDPEPRPEFPVSFPSKRRGRNFLPNPSGQLRVGKRCLGPPFTRLGRMVPSIPSSIVRRPGQPPGRCDTGQTIQLVCGGRQGPAHRFDLHRRKGFSSSRCRIRSRNSSLSITRLVTADFSVFFSSSTPSTIRLFRPSSPPCRNASRQRVSAAAVTPYCRLIASRSSPRNSSNTTVTLRRDRPPALSAPHFENPAPLRSPYGLPSRFRIPPSFLWTYRDPPALLVSQITVQRNRGAGEELERPTSLRNLQPALYESRLEHFRRFQAEFYEGARPNPLSHNNEELFFVEYPDLGLVVVGFASWYGNDCLCHIGEINPKLLASSQRLVARSRMPIAVAVWHHSVAGGPRAHDYMDQRIVHRLIDFGFSVGLHGHQHYPGAAPYELHLPNLTSMAVIGAGSLAVGDNELPMGECRQLNVVVIDPDSDSITVHVRGMSPAGVFTGSHRDDFGGNTFIKLSLPATQRRAKSPTTIQRLDEAMTAVRVERYEQALALIADIPSSRSTEKRQIEVEGCVATLADSGW